MRRGRVSQAVYHEEAGGALFLSKLLDNPPCINGYREQQAAREKPMTGGKSERRRIISFMRRINGALLSVLGAGIRIVISFT